MFLASPRRGSTVYPATAFVAWCFQQDGGEGKRVLHTGLPIKTGLLLPATSSSSHAGPHDIMVSNFFFFFLLLGGELGNSETLNKGNITYNM